MSICTGIESLNGGYFVMYCALPSGLKLHFREDDEKRKTDAKEHVELSRGG